MFHNFSLQKSATSLSLLLFGATASLLGTQLMPTNTLLVKQLAAQPTLNQWVQANTSAVTTDNTPNTFTDLTNTNSTLPSDSNTNTTEVSEKVGAGMM